MRSKGNRKSANVPIASLTPNHRLCVCVSDRKKLETLGD